MKSRFIFLLPFVAHLNLAAQDVAVEINLSQPYVKSYFHIGVTHTHGFWEYGNQTAAGIYFAEIRGLEKPTVKKFYILQ